MIEHFLFSIKCIENDHSGILIEQFLDENRSQLTHYGILKLNETMRDNQLAVLFRNNHFSTIWKHNVSNILSLKNLFFSKYKIT